MTDAMFCFPSRSWSGQVTDLPPPLQEFNEKKKYLTCFVCDEYIMQIIRLLKWNFVVKL